ncbi:MAG: hypothetical protein LUG21_05020 [Clostridiales bacterium]|nr:hypothetical protein [Clostridiales bacterium]
MNVRYWWTEDGTAEICSIKNIEALENTKCYHKNCNIEKGQSIYELLSQDNDKYLICENCFNQAAKQI